MKNLTTEVIILGHRNLGEYDKNILLYCEHLGKIQAVAKGSRKITSKFTGHLETLNVCNVSLYFGPRNIIISEIQTIKNWSAMRDDLEKLKSALQISEITNHMIYENQIIDQLNHLIKTTVEFLQHTPNCELVAISYIMKLLDKLGLIPNFRDLITDKLEEKYLRFFHFILNEPLEKIITIRLTAEEKRKAFGIVNKIVETHTEKSFILETFKTP